MEGESLKMKKYLFLYLILFSCTNTISSYNHFYIYDSETKIVKMGNSGLLVKLPLNNEFMVNTINLGDQKYIMTFSDNISYKTFIVNKNEFHLISEELEDMAYTQKGRLFAIPKYDKTSNNWSIDIKDSSLSSIMMLKGKSNYTCPSFSRNGLNLFCVKDSSIIKINLQTMSEFVICKIKSDDFFRLQNINYGHARIYELNDSTIFVDHFTRYFAVNYIGKRSFEISKNKATTNDILFINSDSLRIFAIMEKFDDNDDKAYANLVQINFTEFAGINLKYLTQKSILSDLNQISDTDILFSEYDEKSKNIYKYNVVTHKKTKYGTIPLSHQIISY